MSNAAGPPTAFSVLKKSQTTTPEFMTYAGGSSRIMTINFVAVLVAHGDDSLLYDSGLGFAVDAQYRSDMPLWKRPLLTYGSVNPAKAQLAAANVPAPRRIVLGHAHWDHASGLVDFPDAEVWTTRVERGFMCEQHPWHSPTCGGTMPSQVVLPDIRWHEFEFEGRPYANFERSLDLYGDGAVVLVPLPGHHTPGSTGMFVTVDSGRRVLFCGDTVWNAKALAEARAKMALASWLMDSDAAVTLSSIQRLRDLTKVEPSIAIVPAHDGLAYFPNFVR